MIKETLQAGVFLTSILSPQNTPSNFDCISDRPNAILCQNQGFRIEREGDNILYVIPTVTNVRSLSAWLNIRHAWSNGREYLTANHCVIRSVQNFADISSAQMYVVEDTNCLNLFNQPQ